MKKQLTTAPVLVFPDLTIPFILTTDASYQGLGAMLSQIGKDNEERAISYSSSTLKPAQENYSVTQLEALAVIWAIEKYKHYLWGKKFTIRTDHSALTSIFGKKTPLTGRLARWAIALQEYDYIIEHRPGKLNPADALSRLTGSVEVIMDDLIPIRKYLDGKGLIGSKNTKQRIQQRAKKFILEKNVLYRLKKEKQLKVLENTSDRLTILKELHDQLGHQGINATFDIISN
jgi:hypothetical protein